MSNQSKREKERIRSIIRKHEYEGKHKNKIKLTPEQFNQQLTLKYYLRISAYSDDLEVVNTQTVDDNVAILNMSFGVYDSAVVPATAFDGCVIIDKRLT